MTDLNHRVPEGPGPRRETRAGRQLLGLGVLLLLLGGLAIGVWRHYALHLEVTATAAEHRDFVPSVRVAAVSASPSTMSVTLPATTSPFEAADIFARATARSPDRAGRRKPRTDQGDASANQGDP